MNHKPLVSVIIPTYNRSGMVGNAIKSALNQTYPNKEIIVVNDGSEDDTETIVQSFENIQYIFQPHRGQAAARNNGRKHSKGTYIALLDSDDEWNPDFLEKCIPVLEEKGLDFVFANWQQELKEGGVKDFFSNDPSLQPYIKNAEGNWVFLTNSDLRDLYVNGCPSPSSSLVLRCSSLKGWNEKMNIADDWDMLLDIVLSPDAKAAFTTERLWYKHINCNNIFDGRDHLDITRLLYVADTGLILSRHGGLFTKKEYIVIERRYLEHLVRTAKHSLFLHSNFTESIRFLKKALTLNPIYTTRIFSLLLWEAGKRQFKKQPDRNSYQ